MTDDELDKARAKEAYLQWNGGGTLALAGHAARLAREGWMPPDPLEADVELLFDKMTSDFDAMVDPGRLYLRKALERGIEIGKGG